jgi:hypothetical protein
MPVQFARDPISDPNEDILARKEALSLLMERAANLVLFLVGQIDTELARANTSYVLPLFAALRLVYDRALVEPLTSLLARTDIDITFRNEAAELLGGLYLQSLRQQKVFDEALQRGCASDPVVDQFLRVSQVDSYYIIFGEELSRADREAIQVALVDLVDNPAEFAFLRDQVRTTLDRIRSFGDLARARNERE